MHKLGLAVGGFVRIEGKKRTAVTVWPSYPEDKGSGVIRLDGFVRRNCGAAVDEMVTVSKIEPNIAEQVNISPSDMKISVDSDFTRFVHNKMNGRSVTRGDSTMVMMLGNTVPFTITNTRPSGSVLITAQTTVNISAEPIPEISHNRTTYEDIGGLDDEIKRVREMVELPLRHPEVFRRFAIQPPKGVLLHGPPGTGKTLLARAVASESESHFITINGPELLSKFYGESETRMREIFAEAAKNAPCVIFIDELDSVAPKRGESTDEVSRRMVATLLAEMDGIKDRGHVIVIGATNRPDSLDEALRRPGRFDREVEIGIPDPAGRLEILQIHTRGMPIGDDVDIEHFADIAHGYTGADLESLARESAMKALARYLPNVNLMEKRVPTEVLETMEVNQQDMEAAFREITPSAMREVAFDTPNIHWDDVGGLEDVKQELIEAVQWPLEDPDMFKRLGVSPPMGILLHGPPGCGKTLLAKVIATESEANFITIKGPELLSKYVGESERHIRDVFRRARQAAPCIIFFDEIDSLVPKRGSANNGNQVTERVVSTLLTEIDGMMEMKDIVVIGATNRPDIIDSAILRPGRFDRRIYIGPPNDEARIKIFEVHTRNMPLADDVNIEKLAAQSDGYSGADIEAVCREAGIHALRADRKAETITEANFATALDKVRGSMTSDLIGWYRDIQNQFESIAPKVDIQ